MTGQNQRDKRRILFVNDEMEMGGVAPCFKYIDEKS